ncbi:MAG: FMN reductase [Candidatus Limnocylindrales bacterium]
MTALTRSLAIVSAGLGTPSATRLLADRLGVAVERHLRDGGIESRIEILEVRTLAQDLTNQLLTGFPSPTLQVALDGVVGSDGLIAVSPIFSASYSGLFKLFFDAIERHGLAGMPTLIAATGGTARHSLALEHALRPLFAYLDAAPVATAVYAASEDWGNSGVPADGGLVERIDRAARELARAMADREPRTRADPFAEPIPFEEMLGGPASPAARRPGTGPPR